jgi:molecular chaperone HscC
MEVRATAGDNLLGGDDFTDCLVELFFERKSAPLSLRKDAIFVQRLRAQVEQAKCKLSSSPQASISVRHGKDIYSMDVDESAFEKACASLLKQLRVPVERALRDANLRAAQLNNVVLAGGATRMPMIRRLVTTMFGRFPALDFNPDEVVAMGAAVQGGLAVRDSALSEVVMTDVAPYSLGVAVVKRLSPTVVSGGHFDPIVERNSTVPISRVKTYFPTQDNQMELRLEIYQGEARMVRDNVLLGTLQLSLPEGKAGQEGVDVRFTYDVNGLLEVETLMLSTQEKTRMLIEGNPGLLSESEIATRLAGLNQLKIHPRDQLENRTLMARAERLYQQLHGDIREWLGSHITELEYALTTQEPRTISGIKQRLEELLAHIERDSYI